MLLERDGEEPGERIPCTGELYWMRMRPDEMGNGFDRGQCCVGQYYMIITSVDFGVYFYACFVADFCLLGSPGSMQNM
jgi:hypothetical protein